MSWFTEVAPAPRRPRFPWRPRPLAAPADTRPVEASGAPLAFAEHELARVAAAAAAQAAAAARREQAAQPGARQAAALERAVLALVAAAQRHAAAERATVAQAVRLATAIARAIAPDGRAPPALAELTAMMLARVEGPVAVRLTADPATAEALRPHLAELAARAGLAGTPTLAPDPALGEGVVRLSWPGGWLEHDPAELARRIADLLAAAGTDPPEMPTTDDGAPDDHA